MAGLAERPSKDTGWKRKITMCMDGEEKDICDRRERKRKRARRKGANIGRAERNEGTEERMRKGNLAVGQADKPLRDFSLALLSSIDVDSKLPRRKAPLSRAVFGENYRPRLALLIVSAISDDAAVSLARRETPCAIL